MFAKGLFMKKQNKNAVFKFGNKILHQKTDMKKQITITNIGLAKWRAKRFLKPVVKILTVLVSKLGIGNFLPSLSRTIKCRSTDGLCRIFKIA